MTGLRKEIKQIENEIFEIHTPKLTGVQILDASKPITEYIEQVRDLRHRFGHQQFIAISAQMDQDETTKEQQQEIARLAELQKTEAQRTAENTPLNKFIRAIKMKNASYDALNAWVRDTTNEQRKQTLREFETLAARRGLALTTEQIDFATNFLRSAITATPTEPQATPQQPSVLARIKNSLGH